MNKFEAESTRGDIKDLGRLLMKRIGEEIPVLPVPLVAYALLMADGPLTQPELELSVVQLMAALPNAHVHLPRDDKAYATEVGLRNLIKRKLVQEVDGQISLFEPDRDIVAYYAASIAHLFPKCSD